MRFVSWCRLLWWSVEPVAFFHSNSNARWGKHKNSYTLTHTPTHTHASFGRTNTHRRGTRKISVYRRRRSLHADVDIHLLCMRFRNLHTGAHTVTMKNPQLLRISRYSAVFRFATFRSLVRAIRSFCSSKRVHYSRTPRIAMNNSK